MNRFRQAFTDLKEMVLCGSRRKGRSSCENYPTEIMREPCNTYWKDVRVYKHMSLGITFSTSLRVRPAKTQIGLRISASRSESSLSTGRRFRSSATHRVHCKSFFFFFFFFFSGFADA